MSHFNGEDPFVEMRSPVTPLVGPAEAAAQRNRVVARMRRLQESTRQQRGAARIARRHSRAILAALAITAALGSALAFYRDSTEARPAAVTTPFVQTNPSNVPIRRVARGARGARKVVADTEANEDDSLAPEPVAAEGPAVAAPSAPSAAKLPPAGAARPATTRSSLAEENALLEHAMTASRTGNAEHAVSLLDEHLKKYPRSPLARNAELERVRALARSGNLASARAAARRYLARYPDGMGSDEARRIAVGTRSPESKLPAP